MGEFGVDAVCPKFVGFVASYLVHGHITETSGSKHTLVMCSVRQPHGGATGACVGAGIMGRQSKRRGKGNSQRKLFCGSDVGPNNS